MKKRKIRKTEFNQTNEVDMTPMLDIVFIMLIFFIVTTTFVKASGIEISRPSQTPISTLIDTKSITIKAHSSEELVFNGRVVLIDSIRANIESEIAKHPKLGVSIQVAKSLQTGIMVRIVDQVRLAGINQVTVSQLL
jgi:biopolymer transport protein ExbD